MLRIFPTASNCLISSSPNVTRRTLLRDLPVAGDGAGEVASPALCHEALASSSLSCFIAFPEGRGLIGRSTGPAGGGAPVGAIFGRLVAASRRVGWGMPRSPSNSERCRGGGSTGLLGLRPACGCALAASGACHGRHPTVGPPAERA